MLRSNLILAIMTITFSAFSQYGNEWINFDQDYFKLQVAEDGIYRVSAAELEAQGFQTNAVAAERLRLYRNGQEVAIRVSSENSRLLFLEFYGERNIGDADNDLYISPEAQPHQYYSLFTDSSTYFLTYQIAGGQGKRMVSSTDNDNSGMVPEVYHLQKSRILNTSRYAPGLQFGNDGDFSLSQYDFGEGWTGPMVAKNAFEDFTFNLSNAVRTGPVPKLEMLLAGANSLDHVVEIQAGADVGSLRTIGSATFTDRFNFTFNQDLLWSDVAVDGTLIVRMNVVGVPDKVDFVSVSYVEVTFPQSFDLNQGEALDYGLIPNATGRSYLRVNSDSPNLVNIYDVTDSFNPIRLAANALTDRVDVVVNGSANGRDLFGITTFKTVPSIIPYRFQEIDFSTANYAIISHPTLRTTTTSTTSDPVLAFENYRESIAGGSYDVLVTNIQDVYDQFAFGNPSPLAIRNMMRFGLEAGELAYVFLIGKGITVNFDYYRKRDVVHFIPTYGTPGSDLLFSTGFGENGLTPAIATGRITAKTPDEVQAYLDKIIESESVLFDDLWRKNIIQLSGGQTAFELSLFSSYINNFSSIAESEFMGAQTINRSKETTANVEFLDIRGEVNKGVGMITFFGHSGSAVTDIEVGDVASYGNKGRYPGLFLVNGCNAGEIFGTVVSFGEPWVLTRDKGATAFIAHTNFALASGLKRYSDLFYEIAFGDSATYGRPLGDIMIETAKRYFAINSTNISQSQVFQMVLQGDPAATLFAAPSPDYELVDGNIITEAIVGDRILASQDSFRMDLVVKNYGKSILDSVVVRVNQTLPNGTMRSEDLSFPRILNQDTLSFYVLNDVPGNIEGSHLFDIQLDPENSIEELNENNNLASINIFINSGNTIQLLPPDQSVVEGPTVNLLWQPFNFLEGVRDYELEVDTSGDYNSPFLKQSLLTGAVLLNSEIDLTGIRDSTVVHWRTRFANPQSDEDTLWSEGSFSKISNDLARRTNNSRANGSANFSVEQIQKSTLVGINYNTASSRWEYDDTSNPIEIVAFGFQNSDLLYEDIVVKVNDVDIITSEKLFNPQCRSNTLNVVVFDRQTSNPYRPILPTTSGTLCGRSPELIYNFTEEDLIGANRWADQLIAAMDDGDQIVLFNIDSIAFSQWDATLLSSLASLGINPATFSSLTDGQPVIFFGEKGETTATEIISDNTARPITQQILEFNGNSSGKFNSGSITTEILGPAKSWDRIDYSASVGTGDNFSVDVIGISPTGNEVSQFSTTTSAGQLDLSGVNAADFPNLKLAFAMSDGEDLVPPQLQYWYVRHQFPPDAVLLIPDASSVNLQEGDSLLRAFSFYNYSGVNFEDSVDVVVQLVDVGDGTIYSSEGITLPPLAGDTAYYMLREPTAGRVGDLNLSLRFEPRETELYRVNNQINLQGFATVESDNVNPILDVTFDGSYILNGDIVSPNPLIGILLKDQNTVLRKSDTTGVAVALRSGDANDFVRVPFSDPALSYTPASENEDFEIQYTPGPLSDNRYALRVEATDESGNAAGSEPYEISFEVINESTITHFYPYPNPFSTSTRFVFTLTGAEIPDEIKIQIMTVTGRVVREILQDEIGDLKIGNNITQYAWDGRDEFGGVLANGVYFYRVLTNINGEQIKNRGTAADQAFKHGYGKLYILR